MPKSEGRLKGHDEIRKRAKGRLYLRLYSKTKGEVWRSLGTTTLNKATHELVTRFKEEFYGPSKKELTKYNYEVVAEQCFAVKMEKNRSRTREEARRIYDQLIEAFKDCDIEDVDDVRWLKQVIHWKKFTTRTRFNHIRIYAKQIDRYAFKRGLKRFECEFPVCDPEAEPGKVLTDAEIDQILKCASELHKHKNKIMVPLFILFGRYMGMRKGEILGLEWDRVDLEARTVKLRPQDVKTGSRTGKGRTIRIAREVLPLLCDWKEKNASPFVFPAPGNTSPAKDIKNSLWAISKKTKVVFTPHDLKHTFCTVKILIEKKPITEVSEYVGTSVATLQKTYVHSRVDHTAGVVE